MALNIESLRQQFPQLSESVRGRPLVYLDNAATTLMPKVVSDVMSNHDLGRKANVHRGAHFLSDLATGEYEQVRQLTAQFINAYDNSEVIFTRGTTESINTVAYSYARTQLEPGDEILLTEMEHHSNIVPWQLAAREKGLRIRVAPVDSRGQVDLEAYQALLCPRTKLVSFVSCSNTLGTINPVKKMVGMAHAVGAKVMIDAAQSVAVLPTDVRDWDCDFLAFSAHKMFGPFGVGVLWGRKELLQAMPPFQGGGSMIDRVTFEGTEFLPPPHRFEAGTPNVTGVIGLGAAIKFLGSLDWKAIQNHERRLLALATEKVASVPGVRLIGTAEEKSNILSFVMTGAHPSDIGNILDQQGIAVRTGHHCTQPLMVRMDISGTVRASFSIYNTEQDVELFYRSLLKAKELLS